MPGQTPLPLGRNNYVLGMQRLAVGAGAVGLTVPSDKATSAFMRLAGGPIFYTVDTSTPSTANGVEMVDGETALFNLHEILRWQGIQGAAAGTLTIVYYGTP